MRRTAIFALFASGLWGQFSPFGVSARSVQKWQYSYCADGGATDDYACNLTPALTAYVTGACHEFKANTANTGAATIAFNGLAATTIKKVAGGITTDLADNDIRAGQFVLVCYDGANMQMQSTLGNVPSASASWETLTNVADTATSYLSNNTAETATFSFESAFTTGSQFLIRQQTGNPTGGTLFAVTAVDADPTVALFQRAVDGATILATVENSQANAAASTNETADIRGLFAGLEAGLIRFGKTEDYTVAANESSFIAFLTRTDGTTAEAGRFLLNGILDVATGFRIAGGAASNNVLAGNGTNFVSTATSGTGAPVGTGRGVNTSSPYTSGGGDLTADRTITLAYTATLSGNPGLNAGECVFASNGGTGGGILCEGNTADTNEGLLAWNPTSDVTLTLPDASDTLVGKATSDTFTNKTYNVEDTGNVFTGISKVSLLTAGCNNASPGPAFDIPTANGASSACLGTAPNRFGVLTFADAATSRGLTHFRLPSDWTGNVDLVLLYTGDTSSTNNIRWQVSTACVADAQDLLAPSFNATSASNSAGPTTAGQRASVSFSNVAMTNCAAGETSVLQVERIGGDAGDTYAGVAQLVEVEITLRRQM